MNFLLKKENSGPLLVSSLGAVSSTGAGVVVSSTTPLAALPGTLGGILTLANLDTVYVCFSPK